MSITAYPRLLTKWKQLLFSLDILGLFLNLWIHPVSQTTLLANLNRFSLILLLMFLWLFISLNLFCKTALIESHLSYYSNVASHYFFHFIFYSESVWMKVSSPQSWKSPHSLQSLNYDPSSVTNYRPISISPHIGKMFESIVFNCVGPRLNHILTP